LTNKFVNQNEGEATHITNTQVGYILLVDEKLRIRWMATGMPWSGELDVLKKGVGKLIGEVTQESEEIDEPEGEHVAQQAA
jgi:ATP10 protein